MSEAAALDEDVQVGEPEETFSTRGPECPYCNHEHRPSDSGDYASGEFHCQKCGREFEMEVDVMHTWTCSAPRRG